jgi:hypothetical protein
MLSPCEKNTKKEHRKNTAAAVADLARIFGHDLVLTTCTHDARSALPSFPHPSPLLLSLPSPPSLPLSSLSSLSSLPLSPFFHSSFLPLSLPLPLPSPVFGGGRCGLGRGVGGLVGPRAGVDALWRLCCGAVVGGPFAGGRSSVFQRSLSMLGRWGLRGGAVAGGRRRGRPPDGASCSRRAGLQCRSFDNHHRNVHCELPQCSASVRMWAGGCCNLGLPSWSFALPS